MSLRARLALLFTVATLAVIIGAGFGFLWQLHSSATAALDASLRSRLHTFSTYVAANPGSLSSLAGGQEGQNQGQFSGSDELTQLFTPSGKLFWWSAAADGQRLLSAVQAKTASAGPLAFTTTIGGQRTRILAEAVPAGSGTVIAAVGSSTNIVDAAMGRARLVILTAGPLAVAAAGIGAWVLTGAALRPVGRMRRRLGEITEEDPGARLPVPATRDEVASLAITTNGLLDRLQRALNRQRDFIADASHELRTPLTALKAELDLASRPRRSRQELESAITAAASDTERLIRMTDDLLLLAEGEERSAFLHLEHVAVSAVLSAAVDGLTGQAQAHDVKIELVTDSDLPVRADPGRLRQAVDNLLGNAIRHSPRGGVVEVGGLIRGRADRRKVVIQVRDQGPGFPPEFLPHAFERFRRADPARTSGIGGSGLGLAIVASIADAHGGRAVAANCPDGGACVSLELPSDGRALDRTLGR